MIHTNGRPKVIWFGWAANRRAEVAIFIGCRITRFVKPRRKMHSRAEVFGLQFLAGKAQASRSHAIAATPRRTYGKLVDRPPEQVVKRIRQPRGTDTKGSNTQIGVVAINGQK